MTDLRYLREERKVLATVRRWAVAGVIAGLGLIGATSLAVGLIIFAPLASGGPTVVAIALLALALAFVTVLGAALARSSRTSRDLSRDGDSTLSKVPARWPVTDPAVRRDVKAS